LDIFTKKTHKVYSSIFYKLITQFLFEKYLLCLCSSAYIVRYWNICQYLFNLP